MLSRCILLLLLLPGCCQASSRLVEGTALWLQQHFSRHGNIDYDVYRFFDDDIDDRRQNMQWQTFLTPEFRFTTQLKQKFQRIKAGVCNQTLNTITYQMSSGLQIHPSMWLGLGYSDYLHGEAEFGLNQRFALQQGSAWFMQATMGTGGGKLEVRLATARFVAHHKTNAITTNRFADNSLSVTYRVTF